MTRILPCGCERPCKCTKEELFAKGAPYGWDWGAPGGNPLSAPPEDRRSGPEDEPFYIAQEKISEAEHSLLDITLAFLAICVLALTVVYSRAFAYLVALWG